MANDTGIRDLFDRWERVWHEQQYDLVPSCVCPRYIRHDENGQRTVTREAYAAELMAIHRDRPGVRVVVYDHSFSSDRVWFRFCFKWTDLKTGEPRSRAGLQSYRIEEGKLAETCDRDAAARIDLERRRGAGALDEPSTNQVRSVLP